MRLVLASASPRRAALLRAAGFAFEVLETGVDERVLPGEAPDACVRRLAREKSAAAMNQVLEGERVRAGVPSTSSADKELVVLGADTAVVVDDDILGKPCDARQTASMLRRLSGRSHQVLTGISVRTSGEETSAVETTVVGFRALTEEELSWYADTGEGQDKAGGYAIQGLASRFVIGIDGSCSNVVGLPLAAFCRLLSVVARTG